MVDAQRLGVMRDCDRQNKNPRSYGVVGGPTFRWNDVWNPGTVMELPGSAMIEHCYHLLHVVRFSREMEFYSVLGYD